jgi:hypothetical protein
MITARSGNRDSSISGGKSSREQARDVFEAGWSSESPFTLLPAFRVHRRLDVDQVPRDRIDATMSSSHSVPPLVVCRQALRRTNNPGIRLIR